MSKKTEKPKEKDKTLYSHHIFLFPFKWAESQSDKVDLSLFKNMSNTSANAKWVGSKSEDFKLTTLNSYNEFNYFYDFVRPILYDLDISDRYEGSQVDNFLDHYTYEFEGIGAQYCFKVNKKWYDWVKKEYVEGDPKTYRLDIDTMGILLHIYNTGVGVLSFHLSNREESQNTPEDILTINQFGRRIYPPFFDIDKNLIGTQKAYDETDFLKGLAGTKNKELAHSIWLEIDGKISGGETFGIYDNNDIKEKPPFQIPAFMESLFPTAFFKKVKISPVLDDRMFVICWYGNDSLTERIKIDPFSDEWWYRFVFVDGGLKTCQDDLMTNELLKKASNLRWSGFGTFYGVSRYSFVCVTSDLKSLQKDGIDAAFLAQHMQTIYYKMVELVLVQRACLLRYSGEVAKVINSYRDSQSLTEQVTQLYKDYIIFVNKIFFREVTAQDQGIELYNLLQNQMRIGQQVTELNGEIQELHQFANLQLNDERRIAEDEAKLEAEKQTKAINRINIITFIFFPASLILSFFGMNYFGRQEQLVIGSGDFDLCNKGTISVLSIAVFALAFSGLFWLLYALRIRSSNNRKLKR